MQKIFTIDGTHCGSCKALIEDVCLDSSAVKSCEVDFTTGRTILEHDESLDMATLIREIESLGEYKVRV